MVDAKRLKKQYMALRGTYTIKIPDHVEPEDAERNMRVAFKSLGYSVVDHHTWIMWKDRVKEE